MLLVLSLSKTVLTSKATTWKNNFMCCTAASLIRHERGSTCLLFIRVYLRPYIPSTVRSPNGPINSDRALYKKLGSGTRCLLVNYLSAGRKRHNIHVYKKIGLYNHSTKWSLPTFFNERFNAFKGKIEVCFKLAKRVDFRAELYAEMKFDIICDDFVKEMGF